MENALTHGIKIKDKIGYALGDMGGLLTFSLIGAFQNKFYTDVLNIDPAKIVVLILVARIWDAINDPLWGAFIDSRKPTKQGKFRPYIFWFSIPLAVSAVLMFTVIPNLSQAKYLLFAYITYILYGMMYTAVNIPYGSLASVITDDEKERSSLSMWRSIGAGVGGLPGTILLPMIVYTTTGTDASGAVNKTLDGNKFAVGDTVTCVYKLTSPEKLENYQAEISYDTKYLSVKSAYLDGSADSGGLLNYNLNGKIKFNGSNISKGYNYTKEDNFVVVNYEIKATGSTTPTFTWIVATGVSGKAYVKDNKATGGLKIAKEYM